MNKRLLVTVTLIYVVLSSCDVHYHIDDIVTGSVNFEVNSKALDVVTTNYELVFVTAFVNTPSVSFTLQSFTIKTPVLSEWSVYASDVNHTEMTISFKYSAANWTEIKVGYWAVARTDIMLGASTAEFGSLKNNSVPVTINFNKPIPNYKTSIVRVFLTGFSMISGTEISIRAYDSKIAENYIQLGVQVAGNMEISNARLNFLIFSPTASQFASYGGIIAFTNYSQSKVYNLQKSIYFSPYSSYGLVNIHINSSITFNIELTTNFYLRVDSSQPFPQFLFSYIIIGNPPAVMCNNCNSMPYIFGSSCVAQCPSHTFIQTFEDDGKGCVVCPAEYGMIVNPTKDGCICSNKQLSNLNHCRISKTGSILYYFSSDDEEGSNNFGHSNYATFSNQPQMVEIQILDDQNHHYSDIGHQNDFVPSIEYFHSLSSQVGNLNFGNTQLQPDIHSSLEPQTMVHPQRQQKQTHHENSSQYLEKIGNSQSNRSQTMHTPQSNLPSQIVSAQIPNASTTQSHSQSQSHSKSSSSSSSSPSNQKYKTFSSHEQHQPTPPPSSSAIVTVSLPNKTSSIPIPIQNPSVPTSSIFSPYYSPPRQVQLQSMSQKTCKLQLNTYWTGYTCACRVGYQLSNNQCIAFTINNNCADPYESFNGRTCDCLPGYMRDMNNKCQVSASLIPKISSIPSPMPSISSMSRTSSMTSMPQITISVSSVPISTISSTSSIPISSTISSVPISTASSIPITPVLSVMSRTPTISAMAITPTISSIQNSSSMQISSSIPISSSISSSSIPISSSMSITPTISSIPISPSISSIPIPPTGFSSFPSPLHITTSSPVFPPTTSKPCGPCPSGSLPPSTSVGFSTSTYSQPVNQQSIISSSVTSQSIDRSSSVIFPTLDHSANGMNQNINPSTSTMIPPFNPSSNGISQTFQSSSSSSSMMLPPFNPSNGISQTQPFNPPSNGMSQTFQSSSSTMIPPFNPTSNGLSQTFSPSSLTVPPLYPPSNGLSQTFSPSSLTVPPLYPPSNGMSQIQSFNPSSNGISQIFSPPSSTIVPPLYPPSNGISQPINPPYTPSLQPPPIIPINPSQSLDNISPPVGISKPPIIMCAINEKISNAACGCPLGYQKVNQVCQIKCQPNQIIINNSCQTCPNGTQYDPINRECQSSTNACPSGCATCTPQLCLSCLTQGYYPIGNICQPGGQTNAEQNFSPSNANYLNPNPNSNQLGSSGNTPFANSNPPYTSYSQNDPNNQYLPNTSNNSNTPYTSQSYPPYNQNNTNTPYPQYSQNNSNPPLQSYPAYSQNNSNTPLQQNVPSQNQQMMSDSLGSNQTHYTDSIAQSQTNVLYPTQTPSPISQNLTLMNQVKFNYNNVYIELKTAIPFRHLTESQKKNFIHYQFPDSTTIPSSVYIEQKGGNGDQFQCLMVYSSGIPNKQFQVRFNYSFEGNTGSLTVNVNPLLNNFLTRSLK